MSMRVTQRQLYGNVVNRMGNALSSLVDSNLQASSQKRINKPSDDAVGMTRVLNYRTSLESINQYSKNVKTASGWLNLADNTLLSVSTQLTRATELAEQAATGTMSSENREQVSYELRQVYEQLIQLANTKYSDNYIFAGHKNDEPPFKKALSAMSGNDGAFKDAGFTVKGSSKASVIVQFLDDGTIDPQTGAAADMKYRYSDDKGATWKDGVLKAGESKIDLPESVTIDVHAKSTITVSKVTNLDPKNAKDSNNGTWLYVYPTAEYTGDDQDAIHTLAYNAPDTTAKGVGYFTSDVTVRIDEGTTAGNVKFSYSLDGGRNWVEGNTARPESGGGYRLAVGGGFLEMSEASAETVGSQYVVKPQRANIDLEIAKGENITINNVGKDVFGGLYQGPNDENATPVFGGGNHNLFEVLGRLVAYLETNSEDGCAQSVEDLREVNKFIQTKNANIGGREQRLSISAYMLQSAKDTEEQALSNTEDVDLFELTTRMAQQQIALQSVLQSSSMIMQMSLLNFI